MLRGESLGGMELLKGLPSDVRDKVDRLVDALSRALESEFKQALKEGSIDVGSIGDMVDRFVDALENLGSPLPVYSSPDLIGKAVEDALDRLEEELSRSGRLSDEQMDVLQRLRGSFEKVVEKMRSAINSREFASKIAESFDVNKLSPEDWRKIIDEIMDMDAKAAGLGSGIGIKLYKKILLSPQMRFRLKEYLRDLRTAPYFRESYHPIGKRLDARRTFLESSRSGMPMLVFKKEVYKPRAREDVVFIYDVSGSMNPYYAIIGVIAQTLSELGLNVKVWYASDVGMRATSRDFVRELERFGGGGTDLTRAVTEVSTSESLRNTVVILYTDLYEGGGSPEEFGSAVDRVLSKGAKFFAFLTECTPDNEEYRRELERRGIYVKCDVRSVKSFVSGIRDLKYYIRRVALIR